MLKNFMIKVRFWIFLFFYADILRSDYRKLKFLMEKFIKQNLLHKELIKKYNNLQSENLTNLIQRYFPVNAHILKEIKTIQEEYEINRIKNEENILELNTKRLYYKKEIENLNTEYSEFLEINLKKEKNFQQQTKIDSQLYILNTTGNLNENQINFLHNLNQKKIFLLKEENTLLILEEKNEKTSEFFRKKTQLNQNIKEFNIALKNQNQNMRIFEKMNDHLREKINILTILYHHTGPI